MTAPKARRQTTSPPLTAGEYRVMDVLWRLRSATVTEISAALAGKRAYTTVMTVLRVLERKRYVRHTTEGRTFVYTPQLAREEARRTILDQVTRAFFGGSPKALMLNLTQGATWDETLASRLRDLLGEE